MLPQWLPRYEEPTNLLVLASKGVEGENDIIVWWPLGTKSRCNLCIQTSLLCFSCHEVQSHRTLECTRNLDSVIRMPETLRFLILDFLIFLGFHPHADNELNHPLVVHGSFVASRDIDSFFLQQICKVFNLF